MNSLIVLEPHDGHLLGNINFGLLFGLFLKSTDNIVIKFSITKDEYGRVEGKVGTFRIHEDGRVENMQLDEIFNKKIEEEITKLTEEGPPEDYLMN